MIDALSSLLKRAQAEGGECYCALYELNDPELLNLLVGAKFVHIILSNTGPTDDTDAKSRQALHQSGVDVTDRMLGGITSGTTSSSYTSIRDQQPRAVLTGKYQLDRYRVMRAVEQLPDRRVAGRGRDLSRLLEAHQSRRGRPGHGLPGRQ